MQKKKKILIIDDDEAIRDSCRQVLSRKGYDVQTTANPKYPQMEQINKEELELAIRGKKSPQEAAAAIEQRTNDVLKS